MKRSRTDPAPVTTLAKGKVPDAAEKIKPAGSDGAALLPSVEGAGVPISFAAPASALLLDTRKQVIREGAVNGQIDPELQKWEVRRKRGRKIAAALRRVGMDRRAWKMEECGTAFTRATCQGCGQTQNITRTLHCGDRLCPTCASRRSSTQAARWSRALTTFQDQYPGSHASFFTVTFVDTEKLLPFKSYTRPRKLLFRHPYWKQYGLIGGISAFETKLGSGSGLWHSHFHCVIFTREEIPLIRTGKHSGKWQNAVNQEVSDLWRELTGDSYIVQGMEFDGNVRELTKYMTKEGDKLPDERLKELAEWAKGKRFVTTFGKLYNNAAVRDAIDDEEEERQSGLHQCECGCRDFEVESFGWSYKLDRFVLENVMSVHVDVVEGEEDCTHDPPQSPQT